VKSLLEAFTAWAVSRAKAKGHAPIPVVTFGGDFLFHRFEFLWPDEWPDFIWDKHKEEFPQRPYKMPWWRPINAFVHQWNMAPELREAVHDLPRWSITICLRGRIIERTPWSVRLLKPGSIVVRSHKAIHSFEIPTGFAGETWTLFIVGRRKHRQNVYAVTPR